MEELITKMLVFLVVQTVRLITQIELLSHHFSFTVSTDYDIVATIN